MWTKFQDITRDESTATGVVMVRHLAYSNDSLNPLSIKDVNIHRWRGENKWTIGVGTSSIEAANEFKHILGCQLYSHSSGMGLVFNSPDKRIVATILSRLLAADWSLEAACDEICTSININLDDAFDEIPNWYLSDDSYIGGSILYLNTRNELYSSIEIKFSDTKAKIVFKRDNVERSSIDGFSRQGVANSRSIFRLYLREKNIPESTADEMFDKITEKFGLVAIQEAASSSTNMLRFSSPNRLNTVEDFTKALVRLSNLIQGVKTEKSQKIIDKLSKEIMECQWIKDDERIHNLDDLYFLTRQKRFLNDFLYNYREKFKSELISMLHDFISPIQNFDIHKLLNNDTHEITYLRRSLLEKRNEMPVDIDLALMILAKYWPVNTEEPISLESIEQIEAKNRIFVTTGQHLDLASLIAFHDARENKADEPHDKKLINPATNKPITRLNANTIYSIAQKRNDLQPNSLPQQEHLLIERLYDLKALKTLRAIDHRLWQTPLVEHMRRISHLDPELAMRLARNVLKYSQRDPEDVRALSEQNKFAKGLANILHKGLSIEIFASLDNEKQKTLAFGRIFDHIICYGINIEKLLSLSVEALMKIDDWVYLNDFNELPQIDFPFIKISAEDRTAINEKIDELLSQDNQHKQSQSII